MRKLDDWLSSYLEYTGNLEAPDIFHYFTGVSVIGSALRRKVWIDRFFFEWTPNFFIFLIAPAGTISKTTCISVGTRLLRNVDGIQFGAESLTWQSLVTDLSEASVLYQMDDNGLEFFPMSCLTFSTGELGTLLDPHDRDMVDILTRLWDADKGVFKKSTKHSGKDDIENPWINLISGTTPTWIQANFPTHMLETGFSSRIIYIEATKKRRYIANPKKEIADMKKLEKLEADLIHDLQRIAELRGEFEFTKEAEDWEETWYADHNKRIEAGGLQALGGYAARKQTHLAKLAMVLSASMRDDMTITKEDLIQADKVLTLIEPNIQRVHALVTEDDETKRAGYIVDALHHSGGNLRVDILFRLLCRKMGYQDFRNALESCLQSGQVRFNSATNVVELQKH